MSPAHLSRRRLLQLAGLSIAGIPSLRLPFCDPSAVIAQSVSEPKGNLIAPLNRFPEMMQRWLMSAVREAEKRGEAKRAELKTKADAERYVQSVRSQIRKLFGPLPEKTPLNAKITKILKREGYRIENVLFESRPQHLVSGNLYVPEGQKRKSPGVIGLCGHSATGKAMEAYQAFAQNLARLGSVCFLIDPVGQGERTQFLDTQSKSRYGNGVPEHLQMGNVQCLVGEFLGTWMAWDGIRALDYLVSREEVDSNHLGVTGNSGGGTQTSWLCALEPRFTMAAPSCFVTTLRRNAENELPQDIEQCPPHLLAAGLDHLDLIAAMAPKPVILLAQERDFFDVRGTMEAYERLKRLYSLLGAPESLQIHIGSDPHGYSRPSREAMYQFFNRVTGSGTVTSEPRLTLETEEALFCSPQGQVAFLKSRSVFSITRDIGEAQRLKRGAPRGEGLIEKVRDLLKLPPLDGPPPEYRILRPVGARAYPSKGHCSYAVQTEADIEVTLIRLSEEPLISRLPLEPKKAILYVSHRSSDAELREETLVKDLIISSPDATFYGCDVRGIGDSQPNTCGNDQFLKPYGSHYFYAAYAAMLDRPLVGARTFDVLRVLQLLKSAGHDQIHIVAKGWGTLPATFAALLNADIRKTTLKHPLESYAALLQTEDYRWPYATMLPGVISQFDLPDCYAELRARDLSLISPWGAADGIN